MEQDQLKKWRQELHRIPELGFDLPETSEYIRRALTELGYEPVRTATSGWIAVEPGKSREAVALRADMDGLEVTEETGLSYASNHAGRMHACGHDGHMAMLLGLARWLKEQPTPEKTVVLIFQPAEEGPGGARVIVESGILDERNVQSIYGFHLYPGLPEGTLGLKEGPLMARSCEFDIAIAGRGSHAGQPQLGNDALLAGAKVIEGVQSIIARFQDPLKPLVINIGTMAAGTARNVVAEEATLTGTIRCYDEASFNNAAERLHSVVNGAGEMTGTKIELTLRPFYPEVTNDPVLVQRLKDVLAEDDWVTLDPLMLSEDFSYYQEKYAGVFLLLGTRQEDPGFIHPLHNARFNFDERVLSQGVKYYQAILKAEGLW